MKRLLFFVGLIYTTCSILIGQQHKDVLICDFAPTKIAPLNAPFPMDNIQRPNIPDQEFNLYDFGLEKIDSVRIDQSLRLAMEQILKNGGGKIIIPKGIWTSGPIHLENNTELHFEDGAEIYFSTNLNDYLPAVFSRHQGIECYKFSSLIYAIGKENIAITGKGILHGQGKAWWKYNDRRNAAWKNLEQMAKDRLPVEERIFADTTDNFLPPSFIQPIQCKNLFIEGITVKYGPFWTINPTYCENVIIRKIKVVTVGKYGHTRNGDGINPSSCKNVLIEYCDLDTGDDCITIKSGRAEDGIRVGKPSKNMVIRYCIARQGHGGLVIGSETSGGIKNIYMHQCSFLGTDRGIRIKTARERGASVENIFIKNITMRKIQDEAIVINMLRYTSRLPEYPVTVRTPKYNNINISNVACQGAGHGIKLVGLPEQPMEKIILKNITISSDIGFTAIDANNVTLENIQLINQNQELIGVVNCKRLVLNNVNIDNKQKLDSIGIFNPTFFMDSNFTNDPYWVSTNKGSKNEIIIK